MTTYTGQKAQYALTLHKLDILTNYVSGRYENGELSWNLQKHIG